MTSNCVRCVVADLQDRITVLKELYGFCKTLGGLGFVQNYWINEKRSKDVFDKYKAISLVESLEYTAKLTAHEKASYFLVVFCLKGKLSSPVDRFRPYFLSLLVGQGIWKSAHHHGKGRQDTRILALRPPSKGQPLYHLFLLRNQRSHEATQQKPLNPSSFMNFGGTSNWTNLSRRG